MIIAASILSAITCTGCTAFVAEEYPVAHYSEAAPIEMTHAMRVAVPAPLGTPIRQTSNNNAPPKPSLGALHARDVLVEYGVDLPPSFGHSADYTTASTDLGIVSPFNEKAVPGSLLTGFRIDSLDTGAPGLRALRGQLGAQRLVYGTLGQERYDAEISFAAPRSVTGLNFDIGLVPSASFAEEGNFATRRIGAEFRFGRDIDQRGSNAGLPGWYFFAGADGEAVIFNNATASNGFGLVNGIQLRDQVTVGDIQAGLNVRRYGTNLAINYIRREVEYELNSEVFRRNEDFGGITLTWRR